MNPEMSIGVLSVKQFIPIIPDASNLDWAKTVSNWTLGAASKGLMLPRSQEQISELFDKGHSLAMVDFDGNIVSHAGAFPYRDGSIEVGAVYTEEARRGEGLGIKTVGMLLKHLNMLYPDAGTIFALANNNSAPVFKGLGGIEMKVSELHKDVWLACKDCPNRPSAGSNEKHICCDVPYDLTNFAKGKSNPLFDVRNHVKI